MAKIIPQSFYLSEDTVQIAKDLLGTVLVTEFNGHRTSGIITETEAYLGVDDKAAHVFGGKRTKRTAVFYEEGGLSYVYLCYGIHHLFNVVTGAKDVPTAILIRAIKPLDGINTMLGRRNFDKLKANLSAGPGTLSKALGVTKEHNALPVFNKKHHIWLEEGQRYKESEITAGPRVGVDYAEEAALWPLRFRVD